MTLASALADLLDNAADRLLRIDQPEDRRDDGALMRTAADTIRDQQATLVELAPLVPDRPITRDERDRVRDTLAPSVLGKRWSATSDPERDDLDDLTDYLLRILRVQVVQR